MPQNRHDKLFAIARQAQLTTELFILKCTRDYGKYSEASRFVS